MHITASCHPNAIHTTAQASSLVDLAIALRHNHTTSYDLNAMITALKSSKSTDFTRSQPYSQHHATARTSCHNDDHHLQSRLCYHSLQKLEYSISRSPPVPTSHSGTFKQITKHMNQSAQQRFSTVVHGFLCGLEERIEVQAMTEGVEVFLLGLSIGKQERKKRSNEINETNSRSILLLLSLHAPTLAATSL